MTIASVYHIKQPAFPQFRFEYHPQVRKVYLVRLGVEPLIGEGIALEVPDYGVATNSVLIWLRGYREGSAHGIGNRNTPVAAA